MAKMKVMIGMGELLFLDRRAKNSFLPKYHVFSEIDKGTIWLWDKNANKEYKFANAQPLQDKFAYQMECEEIPGCFINVIKGEVVGNDIIREVEEY